MQFRGRGGENNPLPPTAPKRHFLESQHMDTTAVLGGIVYCILKGLHPDSAATTIEALSNLANYEKCNPAERFIFQKIVDGLVQAPAPTPQRKFTVIKGGAA